MSKVTISQLDDLERKAKSVIDEDTWFGVVDGSWHEAECVSDALYDFYEGDSPATPMIAHGAHIAANSPDVTLRLVAMIRELRGELLYAATICETSGHALASVKHWRTLLGVAT